MEAQGVESGTRLLVVDDDAGLRALLSEFLEARGYAVETAENGAAMRVALARGRYDLVLLDVMMPGEDGLAILRSLDPATRPPVILMSVMGGEVDRIVGLELGADDFLTKPFNPREMLARVRAVLRRSGPTQPAPPRGGGYRFAGVRLDPVKRAIDDGSDSPAALTDGEYRLLIAFLEAPLRVLTRDRLLDLSRGSESDNFDRAIDVQISRLRRKLPEAHEGALIRTVRNEGYMFTAKVERD